MRPYSNLVHVQLNNCVGQLLQFPTNLLHPAYTGGQLNMRICRRQQQAINELMVMLTIDTNWRTGWLFKVHRISYSYKTLKFDPFRIASPSSSFYRLLTKNAMQSSILPVCNHVHVQLNSGVCRMAAFPNKLQQSTHWSGPLLTIDRNWRPGWLFKVYRISYSYKTLKFDPFRIASPSSSFYRL